MSSVPSGAWPSGPGPAYPAPPSVWWRIRHSLWLLVPVFGFGCLGGAGFLYVGLRARRPSWWIPGIVYTAAGIASVSFLDEPDTDTATGSWAVGAFLAVWVGSVAHACLINTSWLRWRAVQRPWYAQLAPAPSIVPNPAGCYGEGPAAVLVPALDQPPPAEGSAVTGPVDINTATLDQLAALPGFNPHRAQRVVAERQARRGFGSVEEFAAAASLAPHEFVHIRHALVCGPPGQGPVQQPGQRQHGRVLDV